MEYLHKLFWIVNSSNNAERKKVLKTSKNGGASAVMIDFYFFIRKLFTFLGFVTSHNLTLSNKGVLVYKSRVVFANIYEKLKKKVFSNIMNQNKNNAHFINLKLFGT